MKNNHESFDWNGRPLDTQEETDSSYFSSNPFERDKKQDGNVSAEITRETDDIHAIPDWNQYVQSRLGDFQRR